MKDHSTANSLLLREGEDGWRVCIKEKFILPVLQRVKTPDSIWAIVYVLSIFPHFGSYVDI